MATSYANSGGSGNRTPTLVKVLVTGTPTISLNTTIDAVVDGATSTNAFFFGTGTTYIIEFWFASKKIIDEAKWYQSATASHGTWKWQASNDRTTWTDIGGTFTLGGVTTQTLTSLAGNTTAYIFYRLFQVTGPTSGGPWIYEVEFKIDEGGTTSYLHALGSGNRTGTITPAINGFTWTNGTTAALINGTFVDEASWPARATAGNWIAFDLGASYLMQQARWYFGPSGSADEGTWKLQGSPDNAAWTDLSGPTVLVTNNVAAGTIVAFAGFVNNVTDYRYYRMLGVSGTCTTSPYEREIEFMVGPPAAPPPPSGGGQVKAKLGNKHGKTNEHGAVVVVPGPAATPGVIGPLTIFPHLCGETTDTGLQVTSVTAGALRTPRTPLGNLRVTTDDQGSLRVASVTAGVLGPLGPLGNLLCRTDETGALIVASGPAGTLTSSPSPLLNLRGRTDDQGALVVTGLTAPSSILTGLISYWTLNEASGTRVDAVGGNALTEAGAVASTPGKIGLGALFAGVTNLACASNPSLETGDIDYTFAFWIKPDAGDQYAITKGSAGSEFQIGVFSGLRPGLVIGSASAIAATVVTTTAWAFVVAWREKATGLLSVQVNNGTVTTSGAASTPVTSTSPLELGAQETAHFLGSLDEVGFWKRLLTPAERTTLYNGGAGLTYPFA